MSFLAKLSNLFSAQTQKPFCNEHTFYLWEPCTHSHAEVLPGYARYLLDAGYHVSVLLTPARIDEGLFAHFTHPRLHINRLSQQTIRRYFKKNGLGAAAGILITTSGKLAAPGDYAAQIALFGQRQPHQKVLLVEHDVKAAVTAGTLTPDIITLRDVHYKDAATTVVNPHDFGEFPVHTKDATCRFVTIGALRAKRRNTTLLMEAVRGLHERGITNFRIAIVGKGNLRAIPAQLHGYFEQHGRLDFAQMYNVIAKADFLLPLLDPENPAHERYITTGTSGTFQLAFGFAKPCVIEQKFAQINGFNENNAVVYHGNHALQEAMTSAIALPAPHYAQLRDRLAADAAALAARSAQNLKTLLA